MDAAALIGGKDTLVAGLRAEKYVDLAAEYGWEILPGEARFIEGPALEVNLHDGGHVRVEAEHYLIATGSTPRTDGLDGADRVDYLTSTTAMEQTELPESLVVVGGGYVGLEQAQLFAHLGVRVSIVGRFAPHTEPELAGLLAGVFADDGIAVIAERATEVEADGSGVVVTAGGQRVTGQRLLLATGRNPVTAGLNLDAVGVKTGHRGRWSSTSICAPTTRASGRPGTSPGTRSTSTSPGPMAASWSTTPSATPGAPWTTITCPRSPSPRPVSPPPG